MLIPGLKYARKWLTRKRQQPQQSSPAAAEALESRRLLSASIINRDLGFFDPLGGFDAFDREPLVVVDNRFHPANVALLRDVTGVFTGRTRLRIIDEGERHLLARNAKLVITSESESGLVMGRLGIVGLGWLDVTGQVRGRSLDLVFSNEQAVGTIKAHTSVRTNIIAGKILGSTADDRIIRGSIRLIRQDFGNGFDDDFDFEELLILRNRPFLVDRFDPRVVRRITPLRVPIVDVRRLADPIFDPFTGAFFVGVDTFDGGFFLVDQRRFFPFGTSGQGFFINTSNFFTDPDFIAGTRLIPNDRVFFNDRILIGVQ